MGNSQWRNVYTLYKQASRTYSTSLIDLQRLRDIYSVQREQGSPSLPEKSSATNHYPMIRYERFFRLFIADHFTSHFIPHLTAMLQLDIKQKCRQTDYQKCLVKMLV